MLLAAIPAWASTPGVMLVALGVLLILLGLISTRGRLIPWVGALGGLAAVALEARGLRSLVQAAPGEPSLRSSMAAPQLADTAGSMGPFSLEGLSLPGSVSVLALSLACTIALAGRGVGFRSGVAFLALGAGLCLAAARSLTLVAVLLAAISVLEFVAVGPSRGDSGDQAKGRRIFAPVLQLLVGLLSAGLVAWGAALRASSGGSGSVEWIGTPFAGDLSASLLFVGVAGPLVLPGFLGGAFSVLSRLFRGGPGAPVAFAVLGCLRPLLLAYLTAALFAGYEPLGKLGVCLVWVLALIGLMAGPRWQSQGARLSALAQASLWALLTGQATAATSRTPDAFALGLLGWVLPAAGLALAFGFLMSERQREPNLAPAGLGRLFPLTFMGSVVNGLALAGAPFLLAFHGRTRSAGALNADGGGREALGAALGSAPLFAVVLLPWLHATFFGRPTARPGVALGAAVTHRRKEPFGLLAAVLFTAVMSLAGGALPGLFPRLIDGLVPFNDLAPEGLPSPLGQLQVLLGAALAATFLRRRLFPPPVSLSSAHETE